MQDHERVRYLARNFGELQGLKSALAGVIMLATATLAASGGAGWSLVLIGAVLLGV